MIRLNHGLLGGVWLLSLLACQREPAARPEAAAPPAAAPADTALTTTDTPPAAAPRRDWHRLTRRTNPRAPLISYAAVRRPAASLPAPPPAEARLLDFTLKPSEFFRIDPTQPAEVRGREGTVLRLPALALVDAQQRPVQEPVWLELKECFSLAELLLSDCVSTGPGGEAMQTGGMLLVRASTGRGQALQLAAGSALELALPAELPHAGRQLYHSADRRSWSALPAAEMDAASGPAYAQASTSGSTIIGAAAESSATAADALPAMSGETPTLRSGALGWLTCLRTWRGAGSTGLLVPATVDEHTTLRLVFPESGVILAGEPQGEGYAFVGLPAQQRAVLVGLRYEGGNSYVAVQPLSAGTGAAPLEWREATLGEIEEQLALLR